MTQPAPHPKLDRWDILLVLLQCVFLQIAIRRDKPPTNLGDFAWAAVGACVIPVIVLLAFRFYPPEP